MLGLGVFVLTAEMNKCLYKGLRANKKYLHMQVLVSHNVSPRAIRKILYLNL